MENYLELYEEDIQHSIDLQGNYIAMVAQPQELSNLLFVHKIGREIHRFSIKRMEKQLRVHRSDINDSICEDGTQRFRNMSQAIHHHASFLICMLLEKEYNNL